MMPETELQPAIFELGRLCARHDLTNASIIGEIVSIFARHINVDVCGVAVYEQGIDQPASIVRVTGPWTTDESEKFLKQSRWSSSDRVLAQRLNALPCGMVYRRAQLMNDEEFRSTRLYNDFQRPMGLDDQALALFRRDDGLELLIGVNALRENGPLPESQLRRLEILAPFLARCWAESWRREPAWMQDLRPRSRAILELVLQGLDDLQIAERTGLTYHSVRAHLKRLFREAGVRSRLHLMQACRSATKATAPKSNGRAAGVRTAGG